MVISPAGASARGVQSTWFSVHPGSGIESPVRDPHARIVHPTKSEEKASLVQRGMAES
jgi:hypothetical protein